MKTKCFLPALAFVSVVALSSCESVDYDDEDTVINTSTTTTVTEETVRTTDPYTGTVQTQTTRTVY